MFKQPDSHYPRTNRRGAPTWVFILGTLSVIATLIFLSTFEWGEFAVYPLAALAFYWAFLRKRR